MVLAEKRYYCKYAFFTTIMPNNIKDYEGTTQHRG